ITKHGRKSAPPFLITKNSDQVWERNSKEQIRRIPQAFLRLERKDYESTYSSAVPIPSSISRLTSIFGSLPSLISDDARAIGYIGSGIDLRHRQELRGPTRLGTGPFVFWDFRGSVPVLLGPLTHAPA